MSIEKNDRPTITMRTLGRNGRFGNQLFQYAFLRTYARQHNVHIKTPRWIGQYLFGFDDPSISMTLPQVCETSSHRFEECIGPNATKPYRDVDFWGYFQYHTSYYAYQRSLIENLYQPLPWVTEECELIAEQVVQRGAEIIGIHIRLGDYVTLHHRNPSHENPFFVAPTQWYVNWLRDHWHEWSNPVVYLASDDPPLNCKRIRRFSGCHAEQPAWIARPSPALLHRLLPALELRRSGDLK